MKWHVKDVLKDINENVTVVAATKYFNPDEMRELYNEGITHFGENRVELLLEKQSELTDLNITWHIIGTLQTKKAKKIINSIDFLHSLDTVKLAMEVNKRRTSPLKCFIQVNISDEDSKHGLQVNDVIRFINEVKDLENINIIGLMGMAEHTDNEEVISKSFKKLIDLQSLIKTQCNIDCTELSIGMSNDYLIAQKHNATYLRLGSVLFSREV